MAEKKTTFFLCSKFLLLISFVTIHGTPDNSCSSVNSPSSCRTYVSYFAKSPDFLDLLTISNLFGVSASEIAKSSNLKTENSPLFDGQLLLVPVACNCSENNRFFAKITYRIKQGDTYFLVSTSSFENLCYWKLVQETNPFLKPNKLKVGDQVIFPLFCKCPSEQNKKQGIRHLITYMWRPTDEISDVSEIFNVSRDAIMEEMKGRFEIQTPIFVPVLKLPLLSQTFSQRTFIKHLAGIIVGVALGITLLLVVLYKKKKLPIWGNSNFEKSNLTKLNGQNGQILLVADYLGKPILYDFKVITDATMNFNEAFAIGESVYRATINGEISIIKKLKSDSMEELTILHKVNHINLVKLVGFSFSSDDQKENVYLVYEFAENGSLDKWLNLQSAIFNLTWNQRMNIALDLANGLQYLHDHTQPSIVHRGIKTSCILLDLRFRAKISNLSMAMPATGSLSTKDDVFAFGVVILELLSGKCREEEEEEIGVLCKEIREVLEIEESREERLRDWMDPRLQSSYPIEGALSLAVMARACTQDEALSRPSMAEIAFNLSVLAESSFDRAAKSWVSLLEAEEIGHGHIAITAR